MSLWLSRKAFTDEQWGSRGVCERRARQWWQPSDHIQASKRRKQPREMSRAARRTVMRHDITIAMHPGNEWQDAGGSNCEARGVTHGETVMWVGGAPGSRGRARPRKAPSSPTQTPWAHRLPPAQPRPSVPTSTWVTASSWCVPNQCHELGHASSPKENFAGSPTNAGLNRGANQAGAGGGGVCACMQTRQAAAPRRYRRRSTRQISWAP